MPCRDYETDNISYERREQYKEQCDKLARIACKAMTELTKSGRGDFLILKDDEVREWWEAHQEADRKEKARIAEKERKERVKREALARLSDEEKELLGLSKPKRKIGFEAVEVASILPEIADALKYDYTVNTDWSDVAEMAKEIDEDLWDYKTARKRSK